MHTYCALKKRLNFVNYEFFSQKIDYYDSNITMTILSNIKNVRQDIKNACCKYHININKLKLLAVSKTHPTSAIQAAFESGITEFGESYLQEAIEKIQSLQQKAIVWHFIGPIQSNKTRQIASHFDWVQSVDRKKLLTRLNDQRPSELKPLNICIQLNYFNEPQKKGVNQEELPDLLDLAEQLPNIRLRGFMAIPPKTNCFETQLSQYKKIAACFYRYQKDFPHMDTLSIGMSADIEAAIASGSTMIRVGTALFGQRTTIND